MYNIDEVISVFMYGYTTFHEKTVNSLISAVRDGKNSNAYIFEGDKGLGKTECARLFAQALVCLHRETAPCCSCKNCIEAKENSNPDITYVNKTLNKQWFGSDKKSIGVEIIRRINEDAFIKPFNAPHKVYIIEDGSAMSEAAQNAFLKTLEEPPEFTVFIIIVQSSAVLLDTVISRCELIHFNGVDKETVRRYIFDKYHPEEERLNFLTGYCEGVPGRADDIINDEKFEELRQSALEKLPALLSRNRISAYAVREYLEENKDRGEEIFTLWLSYLRDILVMHYSDGNIINTDKMQTLSSCCMRCDAKTAVIGIEECIRALEMLRRYVSLKSVAMHTALTIKERCRTE